jgi:hypothetical protein
VSTYLDNDNTQEALSFLRFVHARAHEMTRLPAYASQRHFDWTRRRIDPISAENELRVLKNLSALCREQLLRYPTTLEEDIAELASGKWSFGSNKRNALVLLRGEKEICHYFIQLHARAEALSTLPVRTGSCDVRVLSVTDTSVVDDTCANEHTSTLLVQVA